MCLSGLILFFPNSSIEVPKPLCPPCEPTNQTFRAKQLPAIQLQIDFGNEILRFSDWFNPLAIQILMLQEKLPSHTETTGPSIQLPSFQTTVAAAPGHQQLDQNTPANICLVVNLLACGGSQKTLGSMSQCVDLEQHKCDS